MTVLLLILSINNTTVSTVKVDAYNTKSDCEEKAQVLKKSFIGTEFKALTRCI